MQWGHGNKKVVISLCFLWVDVCTSCHRPRLASGLTRWLKRRNALEPVCARCRRFTAREPPLITSSVPVISDALSAARNNTAYPTSSQRPWRPIGTAIHWRGLLARRQKYVYNASASDWGNGIVRSLRYHAASPTIKEAWKLKSLA